MPKDAGQVVVGANGTVSVAPDGTALPEGLAALPAAYTDLGYVTEDGASFSDSKTWENIGAWQAFGPIRRVVTDKDTTLSFSLMQWNADTVPLAFGGGEVTEPDPVAAPGVFRYSPPDTDIDERVTVLDWTDEGFRYRLVITSGMVTEGVETNLIKSSSANLPITIGANHQSDGDTWYLITDDPAFDPAP